VAVDLTEALLNKAAGWNVMKRARAYLEQREVLSSNWSPPLLRGVVQAGTVSFRASMVINGEIEIENLCTCREAREWRDEGRRACAFRTLDDGRRQGVGLF